MDIKGTTPISQPLWKLVNTCETFVNTWPWSSEYSFRTIYSDSVVRLHQVSKLFDRDFSVSAEHCVVLARGRPFNVLNINVWIWKIKQDAHELAKSWSNLHVVIRVNAALSTDKPGRQLLVTSVSCLLSLQRRTTLELFSILNRHSTINQRLQNILPLLQW